MMKTGKRLLLSFGVTFIIFAIVVGAFALLIINPLAFTATMAVIFIVGVFIRVWWFFYEEMGD